MKGKHFRENIVNESVKSRSIILSAVALIEIILLLTTMTFAWFEGLTSLEMKGENIPTYSGLNSEFIVGEGKDYQNATAELETFFDAQASAKFSPVSSYDGENFYALYEGNASSYTEYLNGINNGSLKFRKLSEEDKNSNIVYFQFNVTAKDADATFWLKEMPTVKVGDTTLTNANNPFRIRIDDGDGDTASGEGNLILTTKETWPTGYYSTSASRNNMLAIKSLKADDTGELKLAANPLCNRANYKIFSKTSTLNKNGAEILFTVPKNTTKTITIAIWLEALDQSYSETLIPPGANVNINMKFCSSWDVTDTITFRDYTSDQWIDTTDENNNNSAQQFGIVNLDSNLTNKYWYGNFKYDTNTKCWTGDIPRAVQNVKFIWQPVGSASDENSWTPVTRGTNTTFTAFGSSAGLWYSGDVVKIGLSDNTNNSWLNDDNPKMRVNINYSGYTFDYSMTDSPSTLDGADTWYAYIPNAVDEVRFNRCERDNETNIYNYWIGPGRGEETIYYALESGTEVELPKPTGTTIYLNISTSVASQFFVYSNPTLPAVSLTSSANQTIINKYREAVDNNERDAGSLGKEEYVMTAPPDGDTWPGTGGNMTKISDTLYSFHFDEELPDGTLLTFWNRSQSNNHNNIDNDVSFAPCIPYDANYDKINLLSPATKLTDSQFTNNYIFNKYNWNTYTGDSSGGTEVQQPEQQNGRWGKPELPGGTAVNFKHYTTSATNLTASFTYDNLPYSVSLTKGSDNLTWTTSSIPDSVKSITFSDGTNTWSTSSRSTTNNYYYAVSAKKGLWGASNRARVYFTNNYSWNNTLYNYYWGNESNSWPGTAMTKIAQNNQSQDVYVALIPASGLTGIIFNNNSKQTVDIKSNMTDMTGFYISGESGGKYTVGTWDVDSSFLSTYSIN